MAEPAHHMVKTTLAEASRRIRTSLANAPAGSAETPYLDATILLAEAMGITRERLFAALEDQIPTQTEERFQRLIDERCNGIPISYLLGRKEFYGREFVVDARVLVPRPETELLVETVMELRRTGSLPHGARAHDCCTGSGCVAITMALELPDLQVSASDNSRAALEVAHINAERLLPHDRSLPIVPADLLALDEAAPQSRETGAELGWELVVANPPYLTSAESVALQRHGWPEPMGALEAGGAGTEVIERLAWQAFQRLIPYGYLVMEIGYQQGARCRELLQSVGYVDTEIVQDLAGRDRVVLARHP